MEMWMNVTDVDELNSWRWQASPDQDKFSSRLTTTRGPPQSRPPQRGVKGEGRRGGGGMDTFVTLWT